MKKQLISVFLILIFTLLWALPVCAASTGEAIKSNEVPEIKNIGSACVYNVENKRYIYNLESDKTIYPVSTVKLMTAILTVEKYGADLDHEISVQTAALIDENGKRYPGNRIYLRYGEVLTVEQLLYAVVCGGANDAANVLAVDIGGSINGFVQMMNKKAQDIGARNTHYTNPTGYHDDAMVTTAKDIAIIASYAYGLSPICEMATIDKYVIPEVEGKCDQHTIDNKNYYFSSTVEYKYMWRIAPTPRGLSSGMTNQGGYSLVTTMAKDGLTYIVVVMEGTRDEDTIYCYTEAAKLAKWAINAYDYTKVLTTADMICEIPVRLSSKVDYVTLFPSENVELYLPTDIDLENDLNMTWELTDHYLNAPIAEGHVAGTLTLSYDGVHLGTYDLVTRNSVNRNNFLYILDLAGDAIRSRPFKIIAAAVVISGIGYFGALVYTTLKTKKKS